MKNQTSKKFEKQRTLEFEILRLELEEFQKILKFHDLFFVLLAAHHAQLVNAALKNYRHGYCARKNFKKSDFLFLNWTFCSDFKNSVHLEVIRTVHSLLSSALWLISSETHHGGVVKMIFRSLLSRSRGLLTRSFASTAAPVITIQLPKVEDSRSFVVTSNLRNLKDLQDAIVLEDPSVQSVNALSSEGTIFQPPIFSFLLSPFWRLENFHYL